MATTTKPAVRTCRWGESAYGSPADSPRCGKPIPELAAHPGRQLCAKHIPVWAVEAKKRAAAKPAAEKAPKSAATSPKSTPKPRRRASKSGPVTRVPKSIAMLPPIARVVDASAPAYVNLVTVDPEEGKDS